jgi:hypothetical protein
MHCRLGQHLAHVRQQYGRREGLLSERSAPHARHQSVGIDIDDGDSEGVEQLAVNVHLLQQSFEGTERRPAIGEIT